VTTSAVGRTQIPIDRLALLAPFVLLILLTLAGTVGIILFERKISDGEGRELIDKQNTA